MAAPSRTLLRAGKITPIGIELSNDQKLLPSYSLWFNFRATK